MKPAGLFAIFLVAVLLTSGVAADAQQTAKVPRIGYLSLAAKASPRDEAFVNSCATLGGSMARTSRSSITGRLIKQKTWPRLPMSWLAGRWTS